MHTHLYDVMWRTNGKKSTSTWKSIERMRQEKKTRKFSVYLYVWYTFNVIRLYCAYICICHMLMLILYYSGTTVSLFFHRLEKEKNLLNISIQIHIYIYIYPPFCTKKYRDSLKIELSVSLCTEICTFIKTNTWQLCLYFRKFGVFSFQLLCDSTPNSLALVQNSIPRSFSHTFHRYFWKIFSASNVLSKNNKKAYFNIV